MNIAIITGASSGLGAEYVRAALKTQKDIEQIWIIARRKERLEAIKAELGDILRPIPLDLTSNSDLAILTSLLETEKPDIKLLINNAGYGKLGNFDTLSVNDNIGMIDLNCRSLTAVTAICLPYINSGGEIINTCSIAAFAPNTRLAVYSSTKAFVMSLSRALRAELKPRKINVLACCPGPMDTEFLTVANIPKGASKVFDMLPRVNPKVMAEKSLRASSKKRAVYTNKLFFKFYRLLSKLLPKSITMKLCAA